MPFAIILMPTTAAPPQSQIQNEVQVAISADGGHIEPGGGVRSSDGVVFRLADNAFSLDRLSPGVCDIIFDAARRTNTYVAVAGADATPVKMKGSIGETLKDIPSVIVAANPASLCTKLQRDLDAWSHFMKTARSEGVLGPDDQLLEPPPGPGEEVRLIDAPGGVAAQCDTDGRKMYAQMGWTIIATVISQSPKWGGVWRADVAPADSPHPIFRHVCWSRSKSGAPVRLSTSTLPLEMFDPTESIPPLAPEQAPPR